jgi:glucose-1-phosphate adenylyltransferase
MNYAEMLQYHHDKDADLTVAFVEVDSSEAHRFGIGEITFEDDRGGRLVHYHEKPAKPRGNLASLTILCFRPEILYEMLEENQRHDSFEFGRNIIPMMMERNCKVYGYRHKGYWGYTRTVDEYWKTSMDLLGKKPKINMEQWGLRTNLEHRDIRDCQPLKVGSDALLENCMAYNGCIVEGTVRNSILFPGVRVEKGAEVTDSVLFFNNIVQQDTRIVRTVSDVNTIFGPHCSIGGPKKGDKEGITVIGWNNHVPEHTRIGCGCTVYPRLSQDNWPTDSLADFEELR